MEDKETYSNCDEKDFITFAKEAIGHIKLEVNLKKLSEDAVIPTYAHDGDVGMDLTAISVEYDAEKDMYVYHTGLSFETDKHYGIFLFLRSSNRKTDAYLCNHVGIADSAIYRGEIILCFKNRTSLNVRCEMERSRYFFDNFNKIDNERISDGLNCLKQDILSNPMRFAPYSVGDRIAQMVVLPYPNIQLIERYCLSDSDRGDNGFGSTGN